MSSKKLVFALLTAALPLAPDALALPTGATFTARVEGNNVGTIRARNRVVDEGDTCRYTLQWTLNSPPLSRTVRCDIDELKASNDFDCNANARRWITSLVEGGGNCNGFDEFGQQTEISTLIAGESSRGLNGIIFAESVGDVQSFRVQ